jgi:glucuronoarabinoxylan endo-1,4-beta-xylanase
MVASALEVCVRTRQFSVLAILLLALVDCGSNGGDTNSGGAGAGGKGGSSGAGGQINGAGGQPSGKGGAAAGGGAGSSVIAGGSSATGGNGPGGGGAGDSGAGAGGAGGSSAGAGGAPMTCGGGASTSSDVVVNLSDVHQKISGFGASTAWGGAMSAADADLLWSTTTGAGLSLHRIRIAPDGTTSETNIAKLAVARGATVWATPWTPAAADKSNDNIVMGTLTNGQDFANKLAAFVTTMKNNGVPIYAVSAQNEPDANVAYESCVYTGATMASFIGTYMGPALANSGAKIMAPESQNWCGLPNFEPAILGDAKAASYTAIIATHEYGCSPKAYPEIAQAGKEFWETEIYDSNNTEDPGIGSGLRVAKLIHDAMTIASMNAWHYWWVYPSGGDNGALWDKGTGQPSKRLWVEGNYSRFLRPGFQRVGTTGPVPSGVLVSAYKNPADGTVAVVAINNNDSATPLSLFVSGIAPCHMTPWVTSSSDSLGSKADVSVANSRLSYSLPAQSVTTLVGKP